MDSTSTATAPSKIRCDGPTGVLVLVRRYLELVRFSHTIFALPFAGLASVFAWNVAWASAQPGSAILIWRLLGILICMVSARSAAMAFNRVVDAKIDAANPRTNERHLPAGTLSYRQVVLFLLCSMLIFEAACLLFLPNWLPLLLSPVVLVWICGYSLAKRFTSIAHLWLGTALALSPICAWIALRGESVMSDPMELAPVSALALAIACWVAGFDIIYACQDADFDRKFGLKSLPATLGIPTALRLSAGLHVAMLIVLAVIPVLFPELSLSWIYYCGLAVVAFLVVKQHWIVSPNDLRRVGIAFFNINAVISLGFCLFAGIDSCLG